MKFYTLERKQTLAISLEQAWEFFSSQHNLQQITPPYMHMKVLSQTGGDKAYGGQIITYTLAPLLGISLKWMTEITQVKEHDYFVDEQRFGPYALWHHTHFFREAPGGVEMHDLVNYVLPFGVLGQLAHGMFVKQQLVSLFEYRREVLEKMFKTAR